jgi:GGDEF domain-containing protein
VEEQRFAGDGLTVSIGLAAYPADGKLPRTLVAAADENLYASKQTGRNRVTSPPRA